MNRTTWLILACALLGASGGFWLGARLTAPPAGAPDAAAVQQVRVGDQLPSIALPDLAGTLQTVAPSGGGALMINFFATWCAPCIHEMPLLASKAKALGAQRLGLVGIAQDDPEAVREFVAQVGVDYPIVLAGPMGELSTRLGNTRSVLPYSVLVGADGRILATRAGSFTAETLDQWLAPALPASP